MTTLSPSLSAKERDAAKLAVNALRVLSFEAVEKANSGHPGMPMGCADMAYVLWTKFLRFDPTAPDWPDRDRFALSAGHGSMLLYSLLHLSGYDLPMEQLKSFRQWGSMTPGHPEHGHAPGVETTTGPLGQGFANAVGMALAEAMLAARFNQGDFKLVDHFTYGICSDGDLMEGVSAEAASLAGHLGLGKLILLYDDNSISIDGPTKMSFSREDVRKRFEAYGWQTIRIDGHNHQEIEDAIREAQKDVERPSLILARTTIGFGAPNKKNTAGVHGSPLGAEELKLARVELGWSHDPFDIPAEARAPFLQAAERGREVRKVWLGRMMQARMRDASGIAGDGENKHELLKEFLEGKIPADLAKHFPKFKPGQMIATRKASGMTLDAIAPALPFLVGGSADLTPSNNTKFKDAADVAPRSFGGRYIRYGVREHGMVSVNNGMALHGGFIPYGGTFLVFSDYCRPAIRLAALMGVRNIFVFTHDSIFLGEDGPTHQPVEHLEALRSIPNLNVIRPGDAAETPYAWEMALRAEKTPTALCLTRQEVPTLDREGRGYAPASETLKGGYVLKREKGGKLDLILIATGSELHLAAEAAETLEKEDGLGVRVVSMPCESVFEAQGAAYVGEVLPEGPKRLAIEAGVTRGWRRWVGHGGAVIGLDSFGASAPWEVLAEKLGFTIANVLQEARVLLKKETPASAATP
jgi:transketolase